MKKLNPDQETTRLVSSFIDTYLKLTTSEMEEYEQYRNKLDPELREAVMELETSWSIKGREEGLKQGRLEGLQQGLEQGREQGWEEGRLEGKKEGVKFGMAMLLEKQLSLRFGNLSRESLDKIHKLDQDVLLQLNEAILSFRTSADFVNWLAQQK